MLQPGALTGALMNTVLWRYEITNFFIDIIYIILVAVFGSW